MTCSKDCSKDCKCKFKLSVLVCSIYKREGGFLKELLQEFDKQLGECKLHEENHGKYIIRKRHYKDVEVIICLDQGFKRGGLNVGEKRNILEDLALGDYAVSFDDDDKPSPDYFHCLLQATELGYDVVNFWVLFKSPKMTKPVEYDLNFVDHEEFDRFCRATNHVMMIKSSIRKQVRFKPVNLGEDADFAKRLKKVAKTQGTITKKLYYYNFNHLTSETQ